MRDLIFQRILLMRVGCGYAAVDGGGNPGCVRGSGVGWQVNWFYG